MKKTFTLCLSLILFFSFSIKAQENDLVKSFINKNEIAIRSIQKASMSNSELINAVNFKKLLELQVISVKYFNSNQKVSITAAFKLRTMCFDYFSKISDFSDNYFKVSQEESVIFKSKVELKPLSAYLSSNENNTLNKLDFSNPLLFNDIKINIQ